MRIDVNDFMPPAILPVDVPPREIPFIREREQETTISITQPIFAGGGIYYNYRAAKRKKNAAKAQFRAAQNETAFNVRKDYFSFLRAREMLKVAEEEVSRVKEQLRATEAKFEAETAPRSDVLRAKAELAAVEARLIEARTAVRLAQSAVNLSLGKPLTAEIALPAEPGSAAEIELSMEESIDRARRTRPELELLQETLAALQESRRASRALFLPSLSAAFDYGIQGEKYEFDKDADYYMLSGVLSWNLFNGFRSKAQCEIAKISCRQVQMKIKWTEQAVAQDVNAAFLTIRGKIAQHRAAAKGLEAATEGYRMTEKIYAEGMCSQLQLMDARTALTEASAREIASRYQYLTALADLKRSMGIVLEN